MTYQEEIIKKQQRIANLDTMEEGIIRALKDGNVPEEGALRICVGRDSEIEEINRLLRNAKNGHAVTKFIEGPYGTGKSFLLKVIDEIALNENFVVSKVTITRDVPFNKFEEVYKKIVQNLKSEVGDSLEDIIKKWLTELKRKSMDETTDPLEQNRIVMDYMKEDLLSVREYANSFAVAIESYYEASNQGNDEIAHYAMAWLKGDANIPFTIKRKFGIKGDVAKENAFLFLKALGIFISSIGYSGLVILIDEAEFIRLLHTNNLRETAYDYIRFIYDECNSGYFKNTVFVFAAFDEWYTDDRRGIRSYQALYNRLEDALHTSYRDLRKPILRLEGLSRDELKKLSKIVMEMHGLVYNWNPGIKTDSVLEDILAYHEERASLTGGRITPRGFIKAFISVLDTVQQNPAELDSNEKILGLFEREERTEEEEW